MTKPVLQVAAKALIINDKNEVLLLREPVKDNVGSQDGLYGSAGGRIDAGESFMDALHREVSEETGLKVEPIQPIHLGEWYPVVKGKKHHIVGIFMLCRAKTTKVKLSIEHDDYKWISPKEVDKYPVMAPEPEAIKQLAKWLEKNG